MSDENTSESAAKASAEAKVEGEKAAENLQSASSSLKEGADHLRSMATAKVQELKEIAGAKVKEFAGVAETKAKELAATAGEKAKEFQATAGVKATELKGQAEKAWGQASDKAKDLKSDGEDYVRKNPIGAVLVALAAGFVVGLLVRKD